MVLSQCSSAGPDSLYLAGMSRASISLNIALLSHHLAIEDCLGILNPENQPSSMTAGLVEGLVLLHYWPPAIVAELSRRWPTVSVVHPYPGTNADLVGTDDRAGMTALVNHLYRAGHREIGFFGFSPEASWTHARLAGYFEAITRAGLNYKGENVVRVATSEALSYDVVSDSGWGGQVLARMETGVDAWVCSSTGTAWTLCRLLLERGIRIPEDVSVTGYHKAPVHPAGLPPLTTTDIVDEELGAAALRMLLYRIEHPDAFPQSLLLSAPVLVQASTRPERGR